VTRDLGTDYKSPKTLSASFCYAADGRLGPLQAVAFTCSMYQMQETANIT
jgi:hypothetical protein